MSKYGCYKYQQDFIDKLVERQAKNKVLLIDGTEGLEILSNDLKKGDLVINRVGWIAELWDSKKGSIRIANVYGFCTEAGSIEMYNQIAYWNKEMERWCKIQLTEKQIKEKEWYDEQ